MESKLLDHFLENKSCHRIILKNEKKYVILGFLWLHLMFCASAKAAENLTTRGSISKAFPNTTGANLEQPTQQTNDSNHTSLSVQNEENKVECSQILNSRREVFEKGTFYLEKIFHIYANNSMYMSADGLKKLLDVLGIFSNHYLHESNELESKDHDDHSNKLQTQCIASIDYIYKLFRKNSTTNEIRISRSDLLFLMPYFIYHLQSTNCTESILFGSHAYEDDQAHNTETSDEDENHYDHDHDNENHNDESPDHDHDNHKNDEDKLKDKANEDSKIIWGIALFSVAIISLLSVVGILIVPMMGKSRFFNTLLTFLVALAVGTLVGDALLHLLPHALGEAEHNHDEGSEEEKKNILISLISVFGIYAFFLFESGMTLLRKHKRNKKARLRILATEEKSAASSGKSNDFLLIPRPMSDGDSFLTSSSNASSNRRDEEMFKTGDSGYSGLNTSSGKLTSTSSVNSLKPYTNDSDAKTPSFTVKTNSNSDIKEINKQATSDSEPGHDHHHHHHGNIANAHGIKDIAWMIIAGDGMHNFSDGLAIGAAFTSSLSAGLSTSLAIFCHELPHELGDFAILIDSGMSIRKALLYNGLCACLAFIGAIIGLIIGEYTDSVKLWILAVTAGGFLYVGLVDMLPQMLRQCVEKDGRLRFVFQNVGFLLGVMIMLIIAWFESSFSKIFDVLH